MANKDLTHAGRWPHAGGCEGCRNLRTCNVCGEPISRETRCTNGRCPTCHRMICTPNGVTSSGHGFGTLHPNDRDVLPYDPRTDASEAALNPQARRDVRS